MSIKIQFFSKNKAQDWYEAWISPKTVIRPVFKIESDAREGGTFMLHARMGAETRKMNGKFLLLEYGRKIRYTWKWEGTNETTHVTVDFIEDELGTRVVLEHNGFTDRQSQELHAQGWEVYLQALDDLL